MPEDPPGAVTRIPVRTERPYEVVVGRDMLGTVGDLLDAAQRVAVLHPATLIDVAVRVAADLEARGHEVAAGQAGEAHGGGVRPLR